MKAIKFRRIAASIALLGLFAQVKAAEEPAQVALPPLTLSSSTNSYPVAAARASLQGRVLVSFNITGKGRPDELKLEQSEPPEQFDDAALKLVKQVRFTVPKNWEDSPDAAHRFQLSVLFKLLPCPAETCTAPVKHVEAEDFLLVTAERSGN